jgi:hypothetical protein
VSGSAPGRRLECEHPPIRFDEYAKQFIAALERTPAEVAADVYVVSLFVYDEEDDHRRPTVTVGFDTEAQVAKTEISTRVEPLPDVDDPVWRDPHDPRWSDPAFLPGGTATDADEARWSYTFWLGNDLGVLADTERDPAGAWLREEWIRELGLWYTDEEEDADFDAAMERGQQITPPFVELVVVLTQQLHAEGAIARIFGRPIPVLIHQTEYDDEIAQQNLRANPAGLADDFARWIDRMYREH